MTTQIIDVLPVFNASNNKGCVFIKSNVMELARTNLMLILHGIAKDPRRFNVVISWGKERKTYV